MNNRSYPRDSQIDERPNRLEEAVAESLRSLARLKRMGGLPPALDALALLAPPDGMEAVVVMRAPTRPIRRDDMDGSQPDSGAEIRITYRRPERAFADEIGQGDEPLTVPPGAIPDLLRTMGESEADPRYQFIALKLLRDRLLPQAGYPWATSPRICQLVIGEAIQRRLINTNKVPNPRNPEFPVTSVSLNREHPEVQALLQITEQAPPQAPAATGEPG